MTVPAASRFLKQPLAADSGGLAGDRPDAMRSRDDLLKEIQHLNSGTLPENQLLLVVVSVADIKRYDDIIRIFGYKFAESMLTIRIEDLSTMLPGIDIFQVGFWSFGFVFDSTKMSDPKVFLDSLVAKLADPVICRGIPIPIKAGVGVCDLKKDMGSSEDFLQSTFLASQVGGTSANEWIACTEDKTNDHRRAFSLISDVFQALTTPDEFELHYQARIDLKTGQCSGAEALLRWRHPTLGVVSPGEFIPLVEMTGYIKPLTGWVLSKAIAQTMAWHKRRVFLNVSVNVSAKNLEEDDFVNLLEEKLNHYNLEPKYLELEFTENSLSFDPVAARKKLQAIRAMGVNIATDDFGTGENSYTGLASNPANIIKIDRSHIANVTEGSRLQAVVKSMITMAHDLGMIVVAEGIETGETLGMMTKLSCDYAQGYYMCRPMLVEDFEAWYEKAYAGG